MNLNSVGHVYGVQQQYEPSVKQSSFGRSSVSQSSDGSLSGPTSSTLHTHAAHVHPATSDPYRPATQLSSNSVSSSMYPQPPLSSPYDRTPTYSAYSVTNSSHSVPQPGYQSYPAQSSPLPPTVAHTQLGATDKPPNPSQTTAPYRPKTSNAYDPPIPPPRASRHVSGNLGSSQVYSPTGATQTFVAQDARHVPYYTNPSELLPPNRYTSPTHVSAPPATTHPPSNARPATGVSPPRRGSHSRIVPGSSIPRESSIGNSPYSAQLESEPPYPHHNTFDHTWPQHAPSMDAIVESTSPNHLGYSPAVSRGNGISTLIQANIHKPGQREEFPARTHGLDIPSSGDQYHYPDTGGEFAQHPTTSSYSPPVPRSLPAPIYASSHESSGYAPTPERIHSPGSSSVHSTRSTRSRDLGSPPPSGIATASTPYAPISTGPPIESGPVVSRGSSPASTHSWKSPRVPHDPYAPVRNTEPFSSTARDRSMSNSSLVSSRSSVTSDLYIPSRLGQNLSEVPLSAALHQTLRASVHDTDRSHGQTLILPAQINAPYAPSPSLLGSNDPLGRTSSRAPVVSFGFGGKLVLCFHGSNTLNTGFDIALCSRQTTGIQMRSLQAVIPESALDHISTSFPGPLFCDPGSPTSLVRAAVATQSKNNKAKVTKYLEVRAEEISRGLGYLSRGSSEHRQAEGKLRLVKLLRVLVEHDGHLSGR